MIKADYLPSDPEVVKDMYKLLKLNKSLRKKSTLIILTIIIFIVAVCVYIFNVTPYIQWYLGFVFLTFIFRENDKEKRLLNQWREESPYTRAILEFHEDKYITSLLGNGCCCLTECNYKRFNKAIETEEYFCWLHDNTSYIIKKSAITEGTPEELSALFKEKLGSRFTVKS